MILSKKHVFVLVLFLESCLFLFISVYGTYGLRMLHRLKKEDVLLDATINTLHKNVDDLEQAIDSWEKYSWCQECLARGDLQMACPNEEVFFI